MDTNAPRPGLVRARNSSHAEREPGLLSGLASLLPHFDYSGVLPSASFERQERPHRVDVDSLRSAASSSGSASDNSSTQGALSRQDSSEVLLLAEQPEASTSGRNGQEPPIRDRTAAAAERHRLGAGGSVDLQACQFLVWGVT